MMTDVEGGERPSGGESPARLEPRLKSATGDDQIPAPSRSCSEQFTWACVVGVLLVIGQAFVRSSKGLLRKLVILCGCCGEDGPDYLSNLPKEELVQRVATRDYFNETMLKQVEGLTGNTVGPVAHVDMLKGETRMLDVKSMQLHLGLGWTPKDARGTVDLDASCILLNHVDSSNINTSNMCYFGQRERAGVKLLGDDVSGRKGEIICVDLKAVPADITCLVFTVNVYSSGKTFEDVGTAYVRLYDGAEPPGTPLGAESGTEYCRCDIDVTKQADSEDRQKQGFVWCTLTRGAPAPAAAASDSRPWHITMVCEFFPGHVAREIKSNELPPGILKPKHTNHSWELFHERIQHIPKSQAAQYQLFYSLAKNHEALKAAVHDVIRAIDQATLPDQATQPDQAVQTHPSISMSGLRRLYSKHCDEKMLENATYWEHVKIFFGYCLSKLCPWRRPRVLILKTINGTDKDHPDLHTNSRVIDVTTPGLASSTKWATEKDKTRSTFWYLARANVQLVVLMLATVLPLILLSVYDLTFNIGTKSMLTCTSTSAAPVGMPSDADFSVPCPQVYLPFSASVPKSTFSPLVTAGAQCLGLYSSYYSHDANRWQSTSQFVCYVLLMLLCRHMIAQKKGPKAMMHFCVRYKAVFLRDCESQVRALFMAGDDEYIKGLGPLLPDKPAQTAQPAGAAQQSQQGVDKDKDKEKDKDKAATPRGGYSAPPAQYDQRGVVWFFDVVWHRLTPKVVRYHLKRFLDKRFFALCLAAISALYVASLVGDPDVSSVWYIFSDQLLPPAKEQRFYQAVLSRYSGSSRLQAASHYHVLTCSPGLDAFPPVKLVYSASKENNNPLTAVVQGLLFFASAYGLVKAQAKWFDWIDADDLFEPELEQASPSRAAVADASAGGGKPSKTGDGRLVPYWDYPSFRDKAMSPIMVQDSLWATKHLRFAYWLCKTHCPKEVSGRDPSSPAAAIDTSAVPRELWVKLRHELFERTDFHYLVDGAADQSCCCDGCWHDKETYQTFNSAEGAKENQFRGLVDFIRVTNLQFSRESYCSRKPNDGNVVNNSASKSFDMTSNPMARVSNVTAGTTP